MSLPRRFALWLLRAAPRRCPPQSQDWGQAMLRELDFIESDWAALLWALGRTTAILRYSARCGWKRWIHRSSNQETAMNRTGKNALGVFAGIGIGLAITAAVIGLWMVYLQYLPGMDGQRFTWKLGLLVFVLPEAIFLASTAALWRKQRPMAIGVLVIAVVACLHFASHLAHRHHWRG